MAVNSQRSQSGAKGKKKRSGPRVEPYDFVRPTQISKEHQVSLNSVSDRLAKSMEGLLSSLVRMPVDVGVERSEHMAVGQFTDLLSNPCAAFLFRTGIEDGDGAIDLSADAAFYLIERLFGGSGESAVQDRPLSELEQSVLKGVVERSLEALRMAWSDHVNLTPELAVYMPTPDDLGTRLRGEAFVIRLTVNFGSHEGTLSFFIPLTALDSFLQDSRTGKANRTTPRSGRGEYRAAIAEDLRHARVAVQARLASLAIDARSIARLSIGQVIQTGQHVELPIELHINGRRRYLGTLGQVRRHVGVQVTEEVPDVPNQNTTRTMRGRIR